MKYNTKQTEKKKRLPRRHKRQKITVEEIKVAAVARASDVSCFVRVPASQKKKNRKSKSLAKHGDDNPSGGIEALLPSLIGVAVLICAVMAKMGFRGRVSVAGIDLGTTNSVICIQHLSDGVGEIECIRDIASNSSIIPSVVSFLEPHERPVGPKTKIPSNLLPHPSGVVVGSEAKRRIDSHPHHTLYNAKRVLGRPFDDNAVNVLKPEVEFDIIKNETSTNAYRDVLFQLPYHETRSSKVHTLLSVSPQQVGSYVVHHLIQMTNAYLGHENVKSAVICVPAKFDPIQRQATYHAFKNAGIKITRVLEEPTSAALAYGLHKKVGVNYILVYDFGGGTLDVSLLYVTDGFVDVMSSDGDDQLGGVDFDAAIAHYLIDKKMKNNNNNKMTYTGNDTIQRVSSVVNTLTTEYERNIPGFDFEDEFSVKCDQKIRTTESPLCTVSSFHTISEQLKIKLSNEDQDSKDDSNIIVSAQCLTMPDGYKQQPKTLEELCEALEPVSLSISLKEYNTVSQKLFDRSVVPLHRLIEDLNMKHEEIEEVVMVGGTTRMPQIRKLVQQAMPTALLNTHIDPDLTVAYGAASVND